MIPIWVGQSGADLLGFEAHEEGTVEDLEVRVAGLLNRLEGPALRMSAGGKLLRPNQTLKAEGLRETGRITLYLGPVGGARFVGG